MCERCSPCVVGNKGAVEMDGMLVMYNMKGVGEKNVEKMDMGGHWLEDKRSGSKSKRCLVLLFLSQPKASRQVNTFDLILCPDEANFILPSL